MTPKEVRFGERYGDDSGWERLLIFRRTKLGDQIKIEIRGGGMDLDGADLVWLEGAIAAAKKQMGIT